MAQWFASLSGEEIRWTLLAVTAAVAFGGGLFCLLRGRQKDAAAVLLAASLLAVFLTLSDFRSVSEYRASSLPEVREGDQTVTFCIDASAALSYSNGMLLPEDGILFAETIVRLQEGDSVLTLLRQIAAATGLQLESSGSYVRGIGGLCEFDCGAESGWMYRINGSAPNLSAADCFPQDGDEIVWVYVTEYQ